VIWLGCGNGVATMLHVALGPLREDPVLRSLRDATVTFASANGFSHVDKTLRKATLSLQRLLVRGTYHERLHVLASVHFSEDYLSATADGLRARAQRLLRDRGRNDAAKLLRKRAAAKTAKFAAKVGVMSARSDGDADWGEIPERTDGEGNEDGDGGGGSGNGDDDQVEEEDSDEEEDDAEDNWLGLKKKQRRPKVPRFDDFGRRGRGLVLRQFWSTRQSLVLEPPPGFSEPDYKGGGGGGGGGGAAARAKGKTGGGRTGARRRLEEAEAAAKAVARAAMSPDELAAEVAAEAEASGELPPSGSEGLHATLRAMANQVRSRRPVRRRLKRFFALPPLLHGLRLFIVF